MKVQHGRQVAGVGAIALMVAALVASAPASATPAGAVPFGEASFHGYATGTEVHVGALTVGTTQLAALDQAFSGASTSTAGLTTAIKSETGSVVQPPEPSSVNAYGTGSGLEVGLATSTTAQTDANQILLAGKAQQVAPPNTTATTKQVGPVSLPPVASASALIGRAAAVYSATQCPIGQPISYGLGNAANVNALTLVGTSPTLNTAGTGTSTAQSTADTYLAPNGDGTFGLSTSAADIIAPLTVNVLGALQVVITVRSAGGVSDPVTLTAKTTGESTGASVKLSTNDLLTVALVAGGTTTPVVTIPLSAVGAGGLHIPLSTGGLTAALDGIGGAASGVVNQIPDAGSALSSALTSVIKALNPVTSVASGLLANLANISLGSIDVDTVPHAIGGAVTSPATVVGGTEAAGALDLLHVDLAVTGSLLGVGLPNLDLADLYVGHLEASANLAAPITCTIPVIKTANPPAVTAGQNFVYTIEIPNPAEIALLSCNLDNITATDTITDKPDSGDPTFEVAAVSNGGTVNQISDTAAKVTWTGLNYTVAAVGDPPNPPITLTITVVVPASSPAGTIQDVIVATGTAEDCNGGASGTENLGDTNGTSLTGMYTLPEPPVTALPPGSATTTTVPGAPGPNSKLPFTGAIGGLWQPFAGLGVLGLGGGALALVRRSRRRMTP
jgi:hypothetical protein